MKVESRADLEKYIAHFNNHEYEKQIAYYAPDVTFKVGSLTLTSPRQIADFYADFHQYSKEWVELVLFAKDGDTIGAVIHAIFEPFKDYVKNGLKFEVGKTVEIITLAFYTLKEGQIHRIRMTRYSGALTDWSDLVKLKSP